MELKEEIINDISNNRIMLYMKGTKDQPMCGFSATIVKILNYYDVDFVATNVLENPNIRVELSKYSNWPTIPQLFVEGELIGGCDIALEMHQQGQLQSVLVKNN
tara:strand:- start:44 stop:355 length:312 start_codon:yes stop_codon:yes gene_type:complete